MVEIDNGDARDSLVDRVPRRQAAHADGRDHLLEQTPAKSGGDLRPAAR